MSSRHQFELKSRLVYSWMRIDGDIVLVNCPEYTGMNGKISEYLDVIEKGDFEVEWCAHINGLDSRWNYNPHNHPFIEVVLRSRGYGVTSMNEEMWSFGYYDVILYPPETWHHDLFKPSDSLESYVIWIDFPEFKPEKAIQVTDDQGCLMSLTKRICDEYQKSQTCIPLIKLYIKTLLAQMLVLSISSSVSTIGRVIQYLDMNLDRKISLGELAGQFYVSKSFLTRQFKKETGMTIIEYLMNRRIETAKRLLRAGGNTLNEISDNLGFESSKYFYKVFKKLTGMTPTEFQNQRTTQ